MNRVRVFTVGLVLAAALLAAVPPCLLAAETASALPDADFARHVERLKQKLPADGGFTVVVQRPFVVIGDEPAESVERRAKDTVGWAVERLKKVYFERDPEGIIDIWLFKDKDSYEKYAREIFGDKPTSRFGYYSPQHRALIMNISTGSGTLVHEIVHPFIATNFSACPSWFNEGLASLYEMCGEEQGQIKGYTNWRLNYLQHAIKTNQLPSFEWLCGTSRDEFYNDTRGTNYGQARYLCYYLQEKGLLTKFYREFRAHAATDPTGYETLEAVLGETDMADFQKRWQQFVLELKFR